MIHTLPSHQSDTSLRASLVWAAHTLGATDTTTNIDTIIAIGSLPSRYYHTLSHFEAIAKAWEEKSALGNFREALGNHNVTSQNIDVLKAIILRAGAHHDLIYLNADLHHLPSPLDALLDNFVVYNAQQEIVSTRDSLPSDATPDQCLAFSWAQALFEKKSHVKLGTNEYLSAVYAALQGLKENIPHEYIIAEMAIIAGTIPFQSHDYFSVLAQRLHAVLPHATLSPHAIMTAAVQLANCDVLNFATSDISLFEKESYLLLYEASGSTNITIESRLQNVCFLNNLLEEMADGTAQIFHAYQGFPSQKNIDALHEKSIANIRQFLAKQCVEQSL